MVFKSTDHYISIFSWKLAVHHVRDAAKKRQKYEEELERWHRDEETDNDLEKFAFRGIGKQSLDVSLLMKEIIYNI